MTAHLLFCTFTALAAIAAVWTLRHRASAALRHTILLLAILQFALPAPWMMSAGQRLARYAPRPVTAFPLTGLLHPGISIPSKPFTPRTTPSTGIILELLWALGAIVCLASWTRRLSRSVPSIRPPSDVELKAVPHLPLIVTTAHHAPGVRGILRPVLILPDGLSPQLTEPELEAIVAHEMAHVRRRDNLTAALAHAIVSIFWFHPLLWWLERRMLAERETACDELVLGQGARAEDYVAAIAKVCHMALAARTAYAGITGANLKQRMEHIMSANPASSSSRFLRAVPAALLAIAVLLPFAGGFLQAQDAATVRTVTTAVDALANAGYGFWKSGNYAQAEETFRRMRVAAPNDIRALTGLAETYWSENRQLDAIHLLETESNENPSRLDYRLALANLYVRAERFDSATSIYQEALQQNPNSEDILFKLAETYRRSGALTLAMDTFQRAIDADPTNPNPVLQLALILEGTGHRDQAIPLYEKVLQLQPDNPVALNNLAFLRAEAGTYLDRALEMAQQAHQKMPDSDDIADTLGWIYIKKNLGRDALALYQPLVEKDPANAAFHYHFALALLQTGDNATALREFTDALRNHPSKDDESKIEAMLETLAR